jgi:hypothetical protein
VTLGGILVVALLLRIWSLRHGLPFVYNVDEEQHFTSRAAELRRDDFDPGYFENPPGLTYVLWVAFAIRYAGRSLTSLADGNPTVLYYTGREIVAVIGTAVVGMTYVLGARFARDRLAGLVGAAVMAVGFVPVWYSKQALNDIPAVLPATLTLWLALRYADEGRRRDLLLAGLMAGLAASTKYTAGVSFLAVIVAAWPRWRVMLAPAAAALVGAVLLNPWLIGTPIRVLDAMRNQSDNSAIPKTGASDLIAPLYYLNSFAWGLGLPAAVLALIGLVLAVRSTPRRLLVVALPALVLVTVLSLFERAFARWALPAYPVIASLAGYAVAWGAARTRRPVLVAAVAGTLACIPGVLASVHLNRLLEKTDTRAEAGRFLGASAPRHSRVIVEPNLPTPLARAGKELSLLTRGFRIPPQPKDIQIYRTLGACWVVSQHTYRERMEELAPAVADAYYTHLREASDEVRTFSPWRPGTREPLNFDWSFDYYPRAYVRPGTEVTVYHLRDCTPTMQTFPSDFVNPFRQGTGDVDGVAV